MTFLEAVTALYDGKKIRHKNWSNKDDYIYIQDNLIKCNDGHLADSLRISDDYELYEEPKKQIVLHGYLTGIACKYEVFCESDEEFKNRWQGSKIIKTGRTITVDAE